MISLIPYIGGKNRMAEEIVGHLKATGSETLVDVFGGSGAITLAASGAFGKRIYNDKSGDLCNLFAVLRSTDTRQRLLRLLKGMPPSRDLWEQFRLEWFRGGYSFSNISDPVERAARTFYRHHYSFGGKVRNGGLSVSTGDRENIKEVLRYWNTLRRMAGIARFWGNTFIENLDALDIIRMYGNRTGVALYCDPPYFGTEHYYSVEFSMFEHVFLAEALGACSAHVVVSYYDHPSVRKLYPEDKWTWHTVQATKNSQFGGGNKPSQEIVIVKKETEGYGHG